MKSFLSLALLALLFVHVNAAEPSIWTVSSRAEILRGDARNISIDSEGNLRLSPRLAEVYKTEQPYIWSSAVDAGGNVYLGTGGEGKVFKVAGGSGSLFADLAEMNVTALAVGRAGEIFAATSPDGKVYRIDQAGKATVYFDAKEKYIWSLAVMSDGSLAVGTGESGKIYRARSANATPESSLMFDTSDTHITCLVTDKSGNLYAGTDSNGLVLRFGADGRPFALLDSPLREIHQLAVGPDGSVYVLALSESAAVAAPAPSPTPAAESKTVSPPARPNPAAPEPPQKSRYDLTGAKSAVYRILPDGGVDILWASPTVSGFSVYAHQTGRGVLLGTSDKGRIYNISNDGRESLALQTDASQVSTMISQGTNLYATSSNQGRLFKIGPENVAEGTYESAVLDAKSVATWGRIWWRAAGGVQIETRSGNTEKPEETWSTWTPVSGVGGGQVASPRAKYLQWRAVLKDGSVPPGLDEVSVSYLPRNIAPEVLSIQMMPANLGLVANPPPQVDPNIELSGLDPQAFGIPVQPIVPRRVYQRAARAFQWTAEDRNGDKLVYDVYYKEVSETAFKLVRQNISENFVTLDGQSLADGRYVLRVVARDTPENPAGQALSGERTTEPFDLDNTQPTVAANGQPQVTGETARVAFTANDRSSYLVRAEYSVNGGPWTAVFADDGISDSAEERYTFDVPVRTAGEYIVTLRVFDASGNAGNARMVVKK
jgi:hypothetical protein